MLNELLFIVALALLNGVFSGAEIAVLNIRRTRLHEMQEDEVRGVGDLLSIRADPERFFATVQIVITAVGVLAGVYAGASVAEALAPVFQSLPVVGIWATQIAFALVTMLVVTLQIVLGELVPKSLALRYSEFYALLVSRPLRVMAWLARPLVWFFTKLSNLVLRPFGDRTTFAEGRLSRAELLQYVDEAATAGNLDPSAGEIVTRAVDFDNLDASSLMVPRPDVQALPKSATLDDIARTAREGNHSRVPIYDGELDNVVGFINIRDVLAAQHGSNDFKLDRFLHTMPYVPETMPAPRVLRELQRQRSHLAMVVDETGMVRGLVTMEDLLEELVGEIYSENDKVEEIIRRQPDGSALVLGRAPVHEVARAMDIELPEGETFSTMAGLAIHLAGRIPESGTVLHAEDGVVLEIVEATPRRVRLLRLRRVPVPDRVEGEE